MRLKRRSARSPVASVRMRSSVLRTSGNGVAARSAVCHAARFSVLLIALPERSASRHAAKPRSSAKCESRRSVSAPRR